MWIFRKNPNFITVTPILVVLEPTISLRRVDYYYIVCSYVWCDVNFAYTMFVCISTTTVRSWESENHPSTWNLKSQTSCVLDHFFYPVMFLLIIMICIGSFWWDPIDYPNLTIFIPCLPLNFWVVPAIALCGFGYRDTHYSWSYFYYQFVIYYWW
jgi:hypothetical protein